MKTLPVAVVTVTYNATSETLARQVNALRSARVIVLVDNGSEQDSLKELNDLAKLHPNVIVRLLDRNYGIAYAQNDGARLAMEADDGLDYLLFLDHDSVPEPQCLSRMTEAGDALQASGVSVAALGPRLVNARTGKDYGFHRFRHGLIQKVSAEAHSGTTVKCDQMNSSGSLIPIGAWRDLGGYNEALFIDHVETDWCFRARRMRLGLFGVADAVMQHEMGDAEVRYWLFGWRCMPYRSPLRHYYISRNSVFLQKQGFTPLRWKVFNLVKLAFTFVYFGFFSTEKRAHRRMIRKGLMDGLSGTMGPYKNEVFDH